MKKFLVVAVAIGLLAGVGAAWGAVKAKAPIKAQAIAQNVVKAVAKVKTPAKIPVKAVAGVKVTASTVKAPVVVDTKDLGADKIKSLAEDFISKYLVDGAKVTVTVKGKVSGLYDLQVALDNGQTVSSRLSADGADFYPTIVNIADYKAKNAPSTGPKAAPVAPTVKKSAKPVVDLFVMSYCPYGTQIEKGILPVIDALGAKIDFQIKFVSYAMHGEKEVKENLTQYCLEQGQSDKYLPYLQCFLEGADSSACQDKVAVDKVKLTACVSATDTQYNITAAFKDQANWGGSFPPFNIYKDDNVKYGVQGSPTLVINSASVESGRDSAGLLKTICASFDTAPDICQTAKLSAASPAPGFGSGTQAAGATNTPACATN